MMRSPSALAAACLLFGSSLASAGQDLPVEDLLFQVLLDDRKIGYHRFSIREGTDGRQVESNARFDVKVFFVPVYSYRHQARETWQQGCLTELVSETDANGKRYAVAGERLDAGFRLATGDAERRVDDGCMMTFAYWNPAFLEQRQLLNVQTGELLEVAVSSLGESVLEVGDRDVPAEGYRVTGSGGEVDIRVWYSRADRRWVGLESVVDNGRTLRYRPVTGDGQLAANAKRG